MNRNSIILKGLVLSVFIGGIIGLVSWKIGLFKTKKDTQEKTKQNETIVDNNADTRPIKAEDNSQSEPSKVKSTKMHFILPGSKNGFNVIPETDEEEDLALMVGSKSAPIEFLEKKGNKNKKPASSNESEQKK